MIAMTVAQVADIVGGELADISAAEAATTRITGTVEFDSRAVTSGGLFLALPGARSDGHDFAARAVDGVEQVDGGTYRRTLRLPRGPATVDLALTPDGGAQRRVQDRRVDHGVRGEREICGQREPLETHARALRCAHGRVRVALR